jgi:hypothetical protein
MSWDVDTGKKTTVHLMFWLENLQEKISVEMMGR